MAVKVYKKFRLIEQSDSKFKINEHRKELRPGVKIEESVADGYNSQAKTSGIYYELDLEATKERDELLTPIPTVDRKALIEEANEMGLDFAKNIKTGALIKLIDENK